MSHTTTKGTEEIHGETFFVEYSDGGLISLSHPEWSLIGNGMTTARAKRDLFETAEILYSAYRDRDPSYMTEEAIQMREWMAKVLEE